MAAPNQADLRALEKGSLAVEPRNEQGVVALFASLCEEEFGLRITDIETRYPDCYAKNRAGREIGIEFEYESSRYNHTGPPRPSPSGSRGHCEWVVCWIDNAKRRERWRRRLKVQELSSLSRFAKLEPGVWIQPYVPGSVEQLEGGTRHYGFTVPSHARKGDLLLVYRSRKDQAITHILELTTTAEFDRKHSWGWGYQADLRTVLQLPHPVLRSRLVGDLALAPGNYFKRPSPLGRSVLDDWPLIRRRLIAANPGTGLGKALKDIGV